MGSSGCQAENERGLQNLCENLIRAVILTGYGPVVHPLKCKSLSS